MLHGMGCSSIVTRRGVCVCVCVCVCVSSGGKSGERTGLWSDGAALDPQTTEPYALSSSFQATGGAGEGGTGCGMG